MLLLVGLARGAYWALTVQLPSPIDETAHFSYVESLVDERRPPIVGEDKIGNEAVEVLKDARSSAWRPVAAGRDPHDPAYGATGESYEGVQPPLYYLLLAPVFALTRPLGAITALYALRLATMVLALLTVPVTYVLARRLFPAHPPVALAAPAALVMIQGFNANNATLGNDGLAAVIGGLALLPLAASARSGLTRRGAVLTGLAVGAGLLTKSTCVMLAPMVVVGLAVVYLLQRPGFRSALTWLLTTGVVAALVMLPWLAWNLHQYGATSASDEVDAITGAFQPQYNLSLGGFYQHFKGASQGYWDRLLLTSFFNPYTRLAFVTLAVSLVVGAVWALRRRRGAEGLALAWLATAWPIAFASMLAVIYGLFGGKSSVVGRHLYPVLAATALGLTAGFLVAFGRRWGGVVLVGVLAVALHLEVGQVDTYVANAYTASALTGRVAAVDQSLAEDELGGARVEVRPPCRTDLVALFFSGDPVPATVAGTPLTPTVVRPDGSWSIGQYHLPAATDQPFVLDLPAAGRLNVTPDDATTAFRLVGRGGDPAGRIYCRSGSNPAAARFADVFAPTRSARAYDLVRGWPRGWAVLGWSALVLALVAAGRETISGRRAPGRARSDTAHDLPTPRSERAGGR